MIPIIDTVIDWAWMPKDVCKKRPLSYSGSFNMDQRIDPKLTGKIKTSCLYPTILCLKDRKPVLTRCSKCVGCRFHKKLRWSNKIDLEATGWDHVHFITMTYDEEHLPLVEAGEHTLPTLSNRDIDLFVRRLTTQLKRHGFTSEFSWYLVGEYGTVYGRPHYHMVLFCD